ncbi:sulfite exporter TauE/SafE family protein [Bythopirellula polymerisocia]|uniref:Probable membrane transporter protein n=1 Tax=Bythopirellula polymerisocia TaxID=2528003 RepID=A0A5C6CP14_9BACT|nr:sulfite exporter TauE/SafE family protein [Bythopirellula polymerisocia]TWU26128.1 Sulfite exporter TauE/SafE [Bythopirellula polymerisocia]
MLYSQHEIILIALVMTFGSVIQGAVGFASGLLGVPLLVICGFSLPEAAIINLISTSLQNLIGAWKLWDYLDIRELIYPTLVRLVAIPLGTATVSWLAERISAAQGKQIVGGLLLVIVTLLWCFKVKRRDRLNLFWQTLAFFLSGFLLGFASIGGAPLVIYVNSLTWGVNKSRAFLFFCSAVGQPLAMWFFWRQFGEVFWTPVCSTVVVLPAILAGLWIGLTLGSRLSQPLFRTITLGLITLTAMAAIISPFFYNA